MWSIMEIDHETYGTLIVQGEANKKLFKCIKLDKSTNILTPEYSIGYVYKVIPG